jgi:hypothetical protein
MKENYLESLFSRRVNHKNDVTFKTLIKSVGKRLRRGCNGGRDIGG